MKNLKNTLGTGYTAPEIELYTTAVESGFAVSLEGGTINDWQIDGDHIDC